MSLVNLNFESQYLNGNTEISIVLPDKPQEVQANSFYSSGNKYKVLWLLHGGYGDHSDWVRKSMIEVYASELNLIVVMPSALNSFYSNWPKTMMGYNMYDFITEELMPLVYNWFPASSKRGDNFIAGLSMGGFGTVKFAVNYPEKFAAAAVLSAAPINIAGLPGALDSPIFHNLIDNIGGTDKFIKSADNTWAGIIETAKTKSLPALYFSCGTDDFLYKDTYLPFKEYAKANGIKIQFEEIASYGHEWRFWDIAIQKALRFFGFEIAENI